jgi:transcriptional regulator with XRE-family HTH domain
MSKQHSEGRTISRKRKLVGFTQAALAQESGVPVQRITYFETGRIPLLPTELDRIRAALKRRAQRAFDAVSA